MRRQTIARLTDNMLKKIEKSKGKPTNPECYGLMDQMLSLYNVSAKEIDGLKRALGVADKGAE